MEQHKPGPLQHIEILGEGILRILKFALQLDKGDLRREPTKAVLSPMRCTHLENAEPVDLVRNGLLGPSKTRSEAGGSCSFFIILGYTI